MFNKILIANRGEIACRIIRTARKLGIATVAVYSEADATALHVRLADEAYNIGPAPSAESYLNDKIIINVALKAGAEAIHPGYGFLAENAQFAEACKKVGIVFVGPPPEAIKKMGSKSAAKQIMGKADVPLIMGYHGEKQDIDTLKSAAEKIGYPIMLKPAAGGGGKGMRVIWEPTEFSSALTSAQREAMASFGDDKMLLEKYLTEPRHIEIQVFADSHDNFVYLFERDCSIQRRHQKIIEEAPASNVSAKLRQEMGATAIAAARAIDYIGAGTIEFLLDKDGQYYFMEMNTRLQVEHPVTEMVTGHDLVEWQLRIAAGEKLPCSQDELKIAGHAIEARIYAEDPENNFLPSIGQLQFFQSPKPSPHIRIDAGVDQGDKITPYYDPMIAKLIVWDKDREQAIQRMQVALSQLKIVGVTTNSEFLQTVIAHPDFQQAKIDTSFIEKHTDELFIKHKAVTNETVAIASLYLLLKQQQTHVLTTTEHDPSSPWNLTDGWRMNSESQQRLRFISHSKELTVNACCEKGYYLLELPEVQFKASGALVNNKLHATIDDRKIDATIIRENNTLHIFAAGKRSHLDIYDPTTVYDQEAEISGGLDAPMPGTVVAVMAKKGDSVACGDSLLVIEAMKMEHTIKAPADGVVEGVFYHVGDMVDEGAELLKLEMDLK